MREINQCTAEVFRRSEKRIRARKRKRKRMLAWCVSLCLFITIGSVTFLPTLMKSGNKSGGEGYVADGNMSEGVIGDTTSNGSVNFDGVDGTSGALSLDSFSFSLTWGCNGISSYDSETGKLVKTKDATHPEDYVTTCRLTDAQLVRIYQLIAELNVTSYPNTYDPHKDGTASKPSMTLILSVKTDAFEKTITAKDIALTYTSEDSEGQRFLTVCKEISDILTQTDEWKALPEYEFFYD